MTMRAPAARGGMGRHGAPPHLSSLRPPQTQKTTTTRTAAAGSSSSSSSSSPTAAPTQQQQQQQQSGPRAVYLDDAPGTRAFVEWSREVGISGLGNKVKPASFGGLRGLASAVSPDGAAEGDILLSVPRSVAITLPPKRRCPEGVPQAWWERDAPWYARLAALLLLEKRRASAAKGGGGGGGEGGSGRPPMGPYLSTLPASFSEMPYFWTDEQLEELQYPPLQAAVREQRREWRTIHKAWEQEAAKAGGGGGGGGGASAFVPSFAELEWAMSAVRSRTFSGPYVASTLASRGRLAGLVGFLAVGSAILGGADAESLGRAVGAAGAAAIFNVLYEVILSNKLRQYVLCPAIDLLNHDSRSGSEATYDYFRDSFSVAAGPGGAPLGKQVFGSYGAQSNDSLAQYYGFAEADNPADAYVLTRLVTWTEEAIGLDAGALVPPARRAALEAAGLLGGGGGGGGSESGSSSSSSNGALDDVKVTRDGFPAATLHALRYLLAEAAAPTAAGTGRPVSSFEAAGGADEEARLASVLAAVVRRELQAMGPSTAEEDLRMLAELDGGGGGSGFASGGGGGTGKASQGRRAAAAAAAGGAAGSGGAASAARRLALRFRAEKKKVLGACLDRLMRSED